VQPSYWRAGLAPACIGAAFVLLSCSSRSSTNQRSYGVAAAGVPSSFQHFLFLVSTVRAFHPPPEPFSLSQLNEASYSLAGDILFPLLLFIIPLLLSLRLGPMRLLSAFKLARFRPASWRSSRRLAFTRFPDDSELSGHWGSL